MTANQMTADRKTTELEHRLRRAAEGNDPERLYDAWSEAVAEGGDYSRLIALCRELAVGMEIEETTRLGLLFWWTQVS